MESDAMDLCREETLMRKKFLYLKDPKPGETVYSLVCRTAFSFGVSNIKLLERLTGQRRTVPLLSTLPGHIKSISEIAPESHDWSNSENIVKDNTQLPYFTYFDDPEAKGEIIDKLAGSNDSYPIAMSLGLTNYPLPASPKHPRYCFSCLKEDLKSIRTTFFHREHQLPGVSICWRHEEPLYHGCQVCGAYPIAGNNLTLPGCCNCDGIISPLKAYEQMPGETESHIWLATQSAAMVNSQGTSCKNIRMTLKQVAVSKELSRGKLLDYNKLASAVEKRYGQEFLSWLNAPAWKDGRPASWVRRMLHNRSHENKRSPSIYFLLFVGTLFKSIEDFEKQIADQNCIDLYTTIKQPEPKSKPKKVVDEITNQILGLCDDPPCGIAGIADRLGISKAIVLATLKEHEKRFPLTQATINRLGHDKLCAIRMDLRNGVEKKSIQENHRCSEWTLGLIELDDLALISAHKEASRKRKTEEHRNTLISMMQESPSITKTEVQRIETGTYEYLQKYDSEWFEETLPRQRPENNSNRSKLVDWGELDRQKAEEIERYLKSNEYREKPVWTTGTHLLSKVDIVTKYHSNKDKFPRVTKLISQAKEDRPTFIKRKLRWAIKNMRANGQGLSVNRLRRAAWLKAQVVREYSDYIITTANELNADIAERSFFLNSSLQAESDHQAVINS
jgi:hypothetical protein